MNVESIKKWRLECHDALNGEIIDTLLAEVESLEQEIKRLQAQAILLWPLTRKVGQ
jgi:hypothetical protein